MKILIVIIAISLPILAMFFMVATQQITFEQPVQKQGFKVEPIITYATLDNKYQLHSIWQYGSYRENMDGVRNYMDFTVISGKKMIGESFWQEYYGWIPVIESDYVEFVFEEKRDNIFLVLNLPEEGLVILTDKIKEHNDGVNKVSIVKNGYGIDVILIEIDLRKQAEIFRDDYAKFTIHIPMELTDSCLFTPTDDYFVCSTLATSHRILSELGDDSVLLTKDEIRALAGIYWNDDGSEITIQGELFAKSCLDYDVSTCILINPPTPTEYFIEIRDTIKILDDIRFNGTTFIINVTDTITIIDNATSVK